MKNMRSSAQRSAKAKATRLTKVRNGKVDASGWTQPHESGTPRMRRAYRDGGKVCEIDGDKDDAKRADKRPRKWDGGPTVGSGDPREAANNMMQAAAAKAPVSGSNPIPTYTSASLKKSPLRGGFKKGGKACAEPMKNDRARGTVPAGSNIASVPKRVQTTGVGAIMPNTDGMKKGGRACKAGGGMVANDKDSCEKNEKVDEGRAQRKAGGRVKGKTNINIIIAPSGGGEQAPPAPMMGAPKPPGMPPMPPAPPAGGPPGAPGAAPPAGGPSPLAGIPPQLIAAAMGGGGGGAPAASMPPSGPPRLPMRAAGGRITRERFGAGSGEGRLEKTHEAAKRGRNGL